MQRKRRRKVKTKAAPSTIRNYYQQFDIKKPKKKPGASAFHFCMSEINRYFGYRRVNYLVHRIQPLIPKLRIMNFHDFLFKTNQIVFVIPHWHKL